MADDRKIGLEVGAIMNMLKRQAPFETNDNERITRMQMWIINYIRKREPGKDLVQGELEKAFNITRATTSSILKRMEKAGLVERKAVFHDGRLKKITLTPEAIKLDDEIGEYLEKREIRMRKGISPEDLDTFFAVAQKIQENLSDEE